MTLDPIFEPYVPVYKSKNFGQFSPSKLGVDLYAVLKISHQPLWRQPSELCRGQSAATAGRPCLG